MKIKAIDAYQVFDSRGNPTIEAVVTLEDGSRGYGMAPAGASKAGAESVDLRDGDEDFYRGVSVFNAIGIVHREIAPRLTGSDAMDQRVIDYQMKDLDSSWNHEHLGGNTMLAVSIAVANAAAACKRVPLYEHLGGGQGNLLPLPIVDIFGGGAHANGAMDFQEFSVVAVGAGSYMDAMEMSHAVYWAAGDLLREAGKMTGVTDTGAWWPSFASHDDALDTLMKAIEKAGYTAGEDVSIAIDVAASHFFSDGIYHLKLEDQEMTSDKLTDKLVEWCRTYPIISLEDPLGENDWEAWKHLCTVLGDRVQLMGDDLFSTSYVRLERGTEHRVANAVAIIPGQTGTVTDTLSSIKRTQDIGWLPVITARAGETEDTFLAHLAVATNAGQIKVGGLARSERTAKWNELLRIQRRLGTRGKWLGEDIYKKTLAR